MTRPVSEQYAEASHTFFNPPLLFPESRVPAERTLPARHRGIGHRCHERLELPYAEVVVFSRELRASVLSGDITVTFRLWQRPQVKVGGQYRVGDGHIEVDSIELVPFAFISHADLRRAGEVDVESLRRRAAHAGPIHDETLMYRIEFHAVASGTSLRAHGNDN
jgi:hypothetical protein